MLADDSHEIAFLISLKIWKDVIMLQNLLSAAVVIGALRVNLRSFQSGFIVLFIIFVSMGLMNFV